MAREHCMAYLGIIHLRLFTACQPVLVNLPRDETAARAHWRFGQLHGH